MRMRVGFLWLALWLTGCAHPQTPSVVVYCALDQIYSEPILRDFERQSGIQVLAKYDLEATKTSGLVNLLLLEQAHPRCDVFWNNEMLQTAVLARAGESGENTQETRSFTYPAGADTGVEVEISGLCSPTETACSCTALGSSSEPRKRSPARAGLLTVNRETPAGSGWGPRSHGSSGRGANTSTGWSCDRDGEPSRAHRPRRWPRAPPTATCR